MSEKFTLMHAEKAFHAVEFMARLLGVSRAGYYAWVERQGTFSDQAARRAHLGAMIQDTPYRIGSRLSWTSLGGPQGAMVVTWDPADTDEIVVVGMNCAARSTDGGTGWEEIAPQRPAP